MQPRRHRHLWKVILVAALLGVGALLSGCHIVQINQPRFAPSHKPFVVELRIESDPNTSPLQARPMLGVKLPYVAWSVVGKPPIGPAAATAGR